jgi:transposase
MQQAHLFVAVLGASSYTYLTGFTAVGQFVRGCLSNDACWIFDSERSSRSG